MMHPDPRFLLVNEAEDAVVGTDKVISVGNDDYRAPAAPDARVYHRKVHRSLREKAVRCFQRERRLPDVLRGDLVRYIDNLRIGVDLEDDPLYARGKGIS